MFDWLSDHRRKKLTEAPFPDSWEAIITRNVAHYCMLDSAEQAHLRALIQVFIAEKFWEGAGGLELNDEIRVTISAQACLLVLGLPHNFYRNILSIIVYPSAHHEYLRLKHDAQNGKKSLLDEYGATNEAEFFAVATEQFFDQPMQMIKHAPDLYNVLKEYYCQDPSERVSRKMYQLNSFRILRSIIAYNYYK